MHILVTGGSGFIGHHFVHMLSTNPKVERVTVFDAFTYASSRLLSETYFPKHVQHVRGNLRGGEIAGLIRKHEFSHVVHMAAETHVDNSITDPDPFIRTNVLGTWNLLRELRQKPGLKMMVYVSTDEVYGSVLQGMSTETDRLNPSSPYSASKAAGEMLCMAEHRTFKTPIVITRGTNTFGTGQHAEKFIPKTISRILKREPVPIYGDGYQCRDWMSVQNHCTGIWHALTRGTQGEIYNLGCQNVLSNLQVVKVLAEAIVAHGGPKTHKIEHIADRWGHDRRYAVDPRKAEQLLEWTPEPCSLESVVPYYMKNEA
jgi:dTDP-glucose 4,6-dehydratase